MRRKSARKETVSDSFVTIALTGSAANERLAVQYGDNLTNDVDLTAIRRFYLGSPGAVMWERIGSPRSPEPIQLFSAIRPGQNFDVIVIGDATPPFVGVIGSEKSTKEW